jgi:hypothetical protein
MSNSPGLFKSRIIAGLQCQKRLWLQVFKPGLAKGSEATRQRFAIGNRVGEVARERVRKAQLRKDLPDYCKLDTLAMVHPVWKLPGQINGEA